MRYVFVSDIHGKFEKLLNALDKVNFNRDADTLVSLGDPFDRGAHNLEVLQFLMELPHKILIWGNHDLRLYDLVHDIDAENQYDYHNGVLETMQSFTGIKKVSSISMGLFYLRDFPHLKPVGELLEKYFQECIYAAEWSDLIAVHGWIPHHQKKHVVPVDKMNYYWDYRYWFMSDWRDANVLSWWHATWADTEKLVKNELFPDKKLIVGHWHAWRLRYAFEPKPENISLKELERRALECSTNFGTYEYKDKLIAIDGCSNAPDGVINTYILETDELPTLIKGEL